MCRCDGKVAVTGSGTGRVPARAAAVAVAAEYRRTLRVWSAPVKSHAADGCQNAANPDWATATRLCAQSWLAQFPVRVGDVNLPSLKGGASSR